MKRICARCNNPHEREAGRYCNDCHAAYMREWRKTHRLSPAHTKRANARSYAKEYRKRGKIVQQPCFVCDSPKSEMHHPDHEQPLLVAWLCRECHLDWHAYWKLVSLRTWNRWHADRRQLRTEAA